MLPFPHVFLGKTRNSETPSSMHSPELFSTLSSYASRRKLSMVARPELPTNESSLEETMNLMGGLTTPLGFRVVDMSILHLVIAWLQCPDCTATDSLELLESMDRQGLASKLVIRCSECNHTSTFLSSQKAWHFYEVNRRVVTGLHLIGRGFADLEKLSGILNMPHPMAKNTFSKHSLAIQDAAFQLAQESI